VAIEFHYHVASIKLYAKNSPVLATTLDFKRMLRRKMSVMMMVMMMMMMMTKKVV